MRNKTHLYMKAAPGEQFRPVACLTTNAVHENVLIERKDAAGMDFNNPVPVIYHFDELRRMGYAEIERRDDGLYATLVLNEPIKEPLWPAIGYKLCPNIIVCIGLCPNPNVDPDIKPIKS